MEASVWDPGVVAALIAAATSLIVALYQTMARRRDRVEIEALRARFDRERSLQAEYLRCYLQHVIEGKENELTAFKETLQLVQTFREKVRSAVERPGIRDPQELSDELKLCCKAIGDCFARNQVHFSKKNCRQAHALKNMCFSLHTQLSEHLSQMPVQSTTPVPEELRSAELEIRSSQARFREAAIAATERFADSLRPSFLREATND